MKGNLWDWCLIYSKKSKYCANDIIESFSPGKSIKFIQRAFCQKKWDNLNNS